MQKKKICKKCNKELNLNKFQTKTQIQKYNGKEYTCTRGTCRKCMNNIYTKAYVQKNKEKVYKKINEWTKIWFMKQKEQLGDYYIRSLLKNIDPNIKITPKLIEIKREALVKKREVKKHIIRYNLIKDAKN